MTTRKIFLLISLLLISLLVGAQSLPVAANSSQMIDDFESGLPSGVDGDGNEIGYVVWGDDWNGTTVAIATNLVADTDPLALPGQSGDNNLYQVDFNVVGWGGTTHAFENETVDTWTPQDWSGYEGVSFWLYGANTGNTLLFEIQDNRNPGSTGSDTEIWNYTFTDDFAGWQYIELGFDEFARKEIGNGAPNDGFGRDEVHGWAFGSLATGGADVTYYLDNVGLIIRTQVVDDFESGAIPSGVDGDGNEIGYVVWGDDWNGTTTAVSLATVTDTDPLALPGQSGDNILYQFDANVVGWGGTTHAFENEAIDAWTPQDWSSFEGICFWLYGSNNGNTLLFEIQDNRNPGSTGNDTEIWNYTFTDDFSGWQFFDLSFDEFTRKEIGNGAPNDGFGRDEAHGWAFGSLATGGADVTYYLDNVTVYGNTGGDQPLTVQFEQSNYDVNEGETGQITVSLNRPLGENDPAQVSVDYVVETVVAIPGRDYVQPPAGTLTFVQDGPSELSFSLETLDDNKYEGTERLILRLSNLVDVAPSYIMQAAVNILDDESYDPLLVDDFELGSYLWHSSDDLTLSTPEIGNSDPLALPGQGAYETILSVAPLSGDSLLAQKEQVRDDLSSLLPADDPITDFRLWLAHRYVDKSLNSTYWTNDYYLAERYGRMVFIYENLAVHFLAKVAGNDVPEADAAQAAIEQLLMVDEALAQIALNRAVANNGSSYFLDKAASELVKAQDDAADGYFNLAVNHYRKAWSFAGKAVRGMTLADPTFGRDFALGEDWSQTFGLNFMYYGQGTGDPITLELLDNRTPDPGPSGWSLAWSDEFDDPAGTPPNPANWGYEIGDGTVNGIPGWGNDELQYYTDSPENAATDGLGNLVISAKEADGSLNCYYGPCEYTSARLISWHKAEFAYGRIESRVQVPNGEDGLWPAFWSLGTDIDVVGWPQTGEIDIMEYVSRLPEEIFGTIHGPGYSGGGAFGNTYPFPGGVSGSYHTFAIEWQPDLIEWYVDGILYHTAAPDDVAPNEWVFNDPVFLLFNLAIGGNFGGQVSEDLTMPQDMTIDYVRVYQGLDTAERFEATFVDDFTGWQEVFVPYNAFTRSADQPAGAPNDGLTLTDVWGYGFKLPTNSAVATAMIDQVRLVVPTEMTVANTNDSGPGSLREAINLVATDGVVSFDSSLASNTISLTSGALTVNKAVTIDGSGAPGLMVSGNNASRVFEIGASASASINNLTIANGHGEAGGGVHIGENGSLTLLDSAIAGNSANGDGGGLLAALGTTIHIERSTISGNSGGVGGGLRTLGDATIINSTISNNIATGWWGGAIFHTDGVMDIVNSTITGNVGPDWAPSAIFVGSWAPSQLSTINLTNSVVSGNQWIGCYAHSEGGGIPTLASGGNNIASDDTCNLTAAGDQPNTDPLLGPLSANGGPTLTHALLVGSPAIDAADTAVCPAIDQRGVTRDAACDVGAFEFVP
ncbi:MAG: family 16 glycosylhydrolase [Chloroflexi bacterium]|nr:family 16 glycosylhydrolase [Chloroflexota bacterium]